jgi:hypothetical protein
MTTTSGGESEKRSRPLRLPARTPAPPAPRLRNGRRNPSHWPRQHAYARSLVCEPALRPLAAGGPRGASATDRLLGAGLASGAGSGSASGAFGGSGAGSAGCFRYDAPSRATIALRDDSRVYVDESRWRYALWEALGTPQVGESGAG